MCISYYKYTRNWNITYTFLERYLLLDFIFQIFLWTVPLNNEDIWSQWLSELLSQSAFPPPSLSILAFILYNRCFYQVIFFYQEIYLVNSLMHDLQLLSTKSNGITKLHAGVLCGCFLSKPDYYMQRGEPLGIKRESYFS